MINLKILMNFLDIFFSISRSIIWRIRARVTRSVDSSFYFPFLKSEVQEKVGRSERLASLADTSIRIIPTSVHQDFIRNIVDSEWERSSPINIVFSKSKTSFQTVRQKILFINLESERPIYCEGRFTVYSDSETVAIVDKKPNMISEKKIILNIARPRLIITNSQAKLSMFINNDATFDYENMIPNGALENLTVFGAFDTFTTRQLRQLSSISIAAPEAANLISDLGLIAKYVRSKSSRPLHEIADEVKKTIRKKIQANPFRVKPDELFDFEEHYNELSSSESEQEEEEQTSEDGTLADID